MDISELINLVIKFGSIALMIVYVIFASVVIKQIRLMVKTFATHIEKQLKLLSWLHLIMAVVVLIITIII